MSNKGKTEQNKEGHPLCTVAPKAKKKEDCQPIEPLLSFVDGLDEAGVGRADGAGCPCPGDSGV